MTFENYVDQHLYEFKKTYANNVAEILKHSGAMDLIIIDKFKQDIDDMSSIQYDFLIKGVPLHAEFSVNGHVLDVSGKVGYLAPGRPHIFYREMNTIMDNLKPICKLIMEDPKKKEEIVRWKAAQAVNKLN